MAPQNSQPPPLPPTVEEAYRRKCIQLKERTKEIEDENDAYRLRLERLKRQIQKSRLERAVLLEAISKRTSTNVEDSEGSPSPPPTPEDKPLRTKRGHHKPSLTGGEGGNLTNASFASQNFNALSPSSDAFSHSQLDTQRDHSRSANGAPKPPKRPSNAFEIYCNEIRPILQAQNKEKIAAGEFALEQELARGWKALPENEKKEFKSRFDRELDKWKEARKSYKQNAQGGAARERSRVRGDAGNRSSSNHRTGHGGRGGSGRPSTSAAAAAAAREAEDLPDDDADDDQEDVEMAEPDPDADLMAAEASQDMDPETEVEDNDAAITN